MGKYPDSSIHGLFSDWHWNACARTSYLIDLDRLWVETRKRKIVGVFDLKFMGGNGSFEDKPTPAEEIVADELERLGIPWYNIYLDFKSNGERPKLKRVRPERHRTEYGLGGKVEWSERDFVRWIDAGIPFPWKGNGRSLDYYLR